MLADHPRRGEAPARPLRLGTWNLAWFPHRHMPGRGSGPSTDIPWLACTIAALRVDALAVQEIVLDGAGREGLRSLLGELDRLTGGRWQQEMDECPRDVRQHVGVLYDASRLRRLSVSVYPELNPSGGACAHHLRPGLAVRFQGPTGAPFQLLSVHLDSGTQDRDYGHRIEGYDRLARRLGAPSARLIVAGDLNVMGCGRCRPPISAEEEGAALRARCSAVGASPPPITGTCTELSSHGAAILDRILLSPSLRPSLRSGRLEVSGICEAIGCTSRARRSEAYRRLSDHCPVVAELSL